MPSVASYLEANSIPEPNSGCQLWCGDERGTYGLARVGGRKKAAHRASYEESKGPIPHGLKVLHRCDVRMCINPDHLFVGTQLDNMRDMMAKGRHVPPRGERQGSSKLKTADVLAIRAAAGTNREIGDAFGVNPSQVSRIKTGARWAHLA